MKITENIIRNIVKEALYNLLDEGTNMQTLYHFTTVDSFANIANRNSLWLNNTEKELRNYNYFVSLTRNKALQGFGNVRIQFNAQKLNTIRDIKIIPFNYFNVAQVERGWDRFPNDIFKNGECNKECEEALVSNRLPNIPKINQYIDRIDICCKIYEKNLLSDLYRTIKNDNIKNKVFIYTNKYDFWRQNDKYVSFSNFIQRNYKQVNENKK